MPRWSVAGWRGRHRHRAQKVLKHWKWKEGAPIGNLLCRTGPLIRVIGPHTHRKRRLKRRSHHLNSVMPPRMRELSAVQPLDPMAQRMGADRPRLLPVEA